MEKETAKPLLFYSRFAAFLASEGKSPTNSIILNHSRLTRPPEFSMLLCSLILLSSQSERYRQSLNMFGPCVAPQKCGSVKVNFLGFI